MPKTFATAEEKRAARLSSKKTWRANNKEKISSDMKELYKRKKMARIMSDEEKEIKIKQLQDRINYIKELKSL